MRITIHQCLSKRKEKKSFIENITRDIEFTPISKSPFYTQRIESVLELLLGKETRSGLRYYSISEVKKGKCVVFW